MPRRKGPCERVRQWLDSVFETQAASLIGGHSEIGFMAETTNPGEAARKLTIRTTALVAAIWTGVFGFSFAAIYLMPNQIFALLALGLVLGAGLTVAVLWFTLRLAEIVAGSGGGGSVVVEQDGASAAPGDTGVNTFTARR